MESIEKTTKKSSVPKKREEGEETSHKAMLMANRWKKGVSGNPKGRPKGIKNELTILREAVLAKSENIVLDNFEEVVRATVELAKQGDPTCLKIIWDRVIPAKKERSDPTEGNDKLNVSIIIQGMEIKEEETIEAEFIEVGDNGKG